MSLVYITYHNENVFDLEKEGKLEEHHKFKYQSKFKDTIRKEAQQTQTIEAADGRKLLTASGRHEHRTMGYAQTPLSAPKQFLRKQQGIKWLRIHEHNCCSKQHTLPPVPTRPVTTNNNNASSKATKPTTNDAHRRIDFITTNIESVKQMQVKPPLPRLVDTANGDRQNLLEAGLLPHYVHGRSFGKVPSYLRVHKQLAQKMRDAFAKHQATDAKGKAAAAERQYMDLFGIRQMTAEERSSILEGLKANFMEQSRLFQRLSLFTDTLAKKMRKTRIENTLRQLEQDIYLMEKNPVIYVSKY